MDDADPGKYMEFLACRWADTLFLELRDDDSLVGVAVMDRLDAALSAVYTFYEPSLARRRLGVFALLWQLEHARRLGLSWLYLGYWIGQCDKMSYKSRFRPLQAYLKGR